MRVRTVRANPSVRRVRFDNPIEWLAAYTAKHKIVLSDGEIAEANPPTEDTPPASSKQLPPAALALVRALERFDLLFRSHIEGKFLNHSEGNDRKALEIHSNEFVKEQSSGPRN